MNHSTNIKDFMTTISSEVMVAIDAELPPRAIQLPLEFVVSTFQSMNPEIDVNNSLFLCYVKSI